MTTKTETNESQTKKTGWMIDGATGYTVLGAAFIESVPDVRISVSRQRLAVSNPSLEGAS